MDSALIIATYNWPRALELALWGLADLQTPAGLAVQP